MAVGVIYTALSKYSGLLISLIISAILARLLTPNDFGVVAIATVLITFFRIFSDLGFGPAIVQFKNLSKVDISNIYSFTVYLGLALAIIFYLLSYSISAIYKNEQLINVCKLLSISVLFSTLNIVPNALLMKAKNFRFVAIRTVTIQILVGIISIITAFYGWGVYALLLSSILSSIFIYIANYRKSPVKFNITTDIESIKKVASYSVYQFLFSLQNFFTRNLDKLLIGKFFGMNLLGYYEKSYRLMLLPVQNITDVITPVMHPVFSDIQNDSQRQMKGFLHVTRLLGLIGFPLSAFLFFASKELVLIVFGPQWESSIPVFKILSFTVGLQMMGSTHGSIFQASNNTKALFYIGLINTIINLTGLLIGIYFGGTIESVATMMLVTFIIGLWNYNVMFKIIFHSSSLPFYKSMILPLILAGIIFTALFFVSPLIDNMNLFSTLLIKASISASLFFGYLLVTKDTDLFLLINKIQH